ncbi:Pycsar system effector family protein, partial [Corynebacterium flavescens]|uniref:Pycsar system effector family protein n=1 Tax=Corynebacterium flavescens TaxID=28028 RepID=UPI0026473F4C
MANEWIRHADAKAGVTLAFVGALGAILYSLVSDFDKRSGLFDVLVVAACALLVLAGVFCGLTLAPRTKDKGGDSGSVNLLYFANIYEKYAGKRETYKKDLAALGPDPRKVDADNGSTGSEP